MILRSGKVILLLATGIFLKISSHGQNAFNFDPSVLKDPTGYKIRAGDRIRLVVQGESDCSVEGQIGTDGLLNLTYVGEARIAGKNKKEAEAHVERLYQEKLIFARPKVLLTILQYAERVVFLTGSVNRKGPYVFPPEVEAMNIVEVIARAGGFNDIARKNKVFVTRTFFDSQGNTTDAKTYEVDVEALSSGVQLAGSSRRFWIYPGDRIEVPERVF